MVQDFAAARLVPHAFVSMKLEVLPPVISILVMLRAELPEFVIVVERGGLVTPIAIVPKLRLGGANVTFTLGAIIFIVSLFDSFGAATEVAVIVNDAGARIAAGAEYVIVAPLAEAVLESTPQAGEQDELLWVRDHVTP